MQEAIARLTPRMRGGGNLSAHGWAEIVASLRAGEPVKAVAAEYGVSNQAVYRHLSRLPPVVRLCSCGQPATGWRGWCRQCKPKRIEQARICACGRSKSRRAKVCRACKRVEVTPSTGE